MSLVLAVVSSALVVLVLIDCFETIVQPRRITRPYRFTRIYYRVTWLPCRAVTQRMRNKRWRYGMLALFGPLSILGLFATWVLILIFSFALLQWSLDIPVTSDQGHLGIYAYMSGVTFFTLGFGDITPVSAVGRFITTIEAGIGFGFLAVTISYLPVLSQAYSTREIEVGLLDARAGSPPTAGQLLIRLAQHGDVAGVQALLREWETWAASLLESHLSFPVLSLYRSQHDNQSWLAAITTILDTCAVLIALVEEVDTYQAQLTFAMSRHAVVDLSLVVRARPTDFQLERFNQQSIDQLCAALAETGVTLRRTEAAYAKLAELRHMYEPFVAVLGDYFLLSLPALMPDKNAIDNWQTSAFQKRAPGFRQLAVTADEEEHFA